MFSDLLKIGALLGLLIMAMVLNVKAACTGCSYTCTVSPATGRADFQMQAECTTADDSIIRDNGGEIKWNPGSPSGSHQNAGKTYVWGGKVDFPSAFDSFTQNSTFKSAKVVVVCKTCS